MATTRLRLYLYNAENGDQIFTSGLVGYTDRSDKNAVSMVGKQRLRKYENIFNRLSQIFEKMCFSISRVIL